ncbi:MAG: peptidase MA family metallohydrolase, partial [Terriglobales bacterium]
MLSLACAPNLAAQYFGQNKVRHRTLHFQVAKTQHFDIYYYPEEAAATQDVARMAERWYTRLSGLLQHQLTTRQTLILYATHADFEQTSVLPGMIEASVGGVTLSTGRKIVLPLAGPLGETDHVLGHELVHAFQYDMTTSRGQPLVAGLPLWFVEGMAEYLSLGPEDAHTAMWLRDAVARDAMPTVQTLSDTRKYFPYRFGQAFWAYVGGRYGDDKIAPLLIAASQSGSVEAGIRAVLHLSPEELSSGWKDAAIAAEQPVLAATAPLARADLLVAQSSGGGRIHASPAVSPDGNWVMFYSERGLFAIDLYLADAHTGRVVRRITATAVDAHYQNLQFISSAGAWSPDSRRFAFGHVQSGQARISIYDLQAQAVTASFPIAPAGAASAEVFSPTWSPDGKQIAFSANVGGLTNLYLLNTGSGAVRRLTDDAYAALQPAWSPDGRAIAFVTDRFTSSLNDLDFGAYRLALLDPASGAVTPALPGDPAGNQTNPQWGPGGASLYYLSDASGVPNLYRFDRASGASTSGTRAAGALGPAPAIAQLTNLQTGVSGITALSPAFSVASGSGAVIY